MVDVHNSRPILATIHTEALSHNLKRIKTHYATSANAKVWAVVKADAYGHHIENVFAGLRGANGFACLDLSEAYALRKKGWRGPILLLEGVFTARDLELCSRLTLWHVIHCEAQINWLAAHKTNAPQRVFLKLNSGMNRLGFKPAQYRAAYARLSQLPQVCEVSHLTHFSDADKRTPESAAKMRVQRERFQTTTQDLDGERSLANSAVALQFAQACAADAPSDDWLRVGIALYGSAPDYPEKTSMAWGLQPAMTLSSRIIGVQELSTGESVGYGSSFVADRPIRIGIVACGYADGYPRQAGNAHGGAPVLVDGLRTRTLGRISMDMLAVDLSHLPGCGFDSQATLWGRASSGQSDSAVLTIDEVAACAGTISYELMCAVASRVGFAIDAGESDALA